MNDQTETNFDHLSQTIAKRGVDPALDWLEQEFTQHKQYPELFEILKMKARRQVGLPLTQTEEELSADAKSQEKLERLLYQACGKVGEMLFDEGRAALAWKYFQLVGDRRRAAQLLRAIPASDVNARELIGVALDEGVAPDYGIELTLRFLGTCSAITSMDQCMPFEKEPVRNEAADLLVRHVYRELTHNVIAEIESREGGAHPPQTSLVELFEPRPWLFAGVGFQVDPSHLAATARLGRMTTRHESLNQAIALCRYGQQLNPSLIGTGETPFEDLFVAHEKYFAAALGRNVETALEYFRERVPSDSANRDAGRLAAEVLVDLLCRNHRWPEALQWSLDWLAAGAGNAGIVPSGLEIAKRSGQLPKLAEWYRQRSSLLMFGVSLLYEREGENSTV